jgi:hypothetical protein
VATRSINKCADFKPNGDFARGNQISRGNRGNYHPRAFRQRYIEETSYEDVKRVMDDLYRRALEEGDIGAAKLWLAYTVGKPTTHVEVTGSGGGPVAFGLLLAAIQQALPDPADRHRVAEAIQGLIKDRARDDPARSNPRALG